MLSILRILHEQGYTNLYLATGCQFAQENMPDDLHVLSNRMMIVEI